MRETTFTPDEDSRGTVDITRVVATLFAPRVSIHHLAQLCRRLATMLEAGVDMRTVWQGEAERGGPAPLQARARQINEAVHRGESITDAFAATGDFFPPLFREMVRVGDETGYLSEVFRSLAEHYEEKIRLRRMFLGAIAWPVTQLVIALAVVGFLIWIMGVIGQSSGVTLDPLGFGLVGTAGLVKYLVFLGTVGLILLVIFRAAQRGMVWTRPIQRAVLRIPAVGPPLDTIVLARFAWALHLTLEAGMPIRRAMRLSLRSTGNARYIDHEGPIDRSISAGNSVYETLLDTGVFPHEFLDAVRVGEDSGRLVESMAHLSRQYNERASMALKTLTTIAGFGVWALVATLIILLIFRLFSFYIGTINSVMP